MGIFTGKGIFCTVVAVLVLIICCSTMPDSTSMFVIAFIVWELYVGFFYSAEYKHKNEVNEKLNSLEASMENSKSQFEYETYKDEYEKIKRSEATRAAGQIIGALGTLAATNAVVDKLIEKDNESFKKTMKSATDSLSKINDYIKTGSWDDEKKDDGN